RSERRSRGYGGPPLAAFLVAGGEVRLAVVVEIADTHIHPGGARAPGRPGAAGEGAAGTRRHPPLAALQPATGDVVLAAAIEIAHAHIHPGGEGAPGGPQGADKGAAGADSGPPLTALQISGRKANDPLPGDRISSAVEIADVDVHPRGSRAPR